MKEATNPMGSKSDPSEPSDELVAKANELYWHSRESVNRLARELDLSKGTLYEIVAPLPADLPCPCDKAEMSYLNRTARDRGFVSCTACGLEDEEDQVRAMLALRDDLSATELGDLGAAPLGEPAQVRPAATRAPATRDSDLGAAPLDPPRHPATPRPRRLEALVAVSVLAGVAAGLFLGGLLRRR